MQKTGYQNIDACDPRDCVASKIMKSQRIILGVFRAHLKTFDLTTNQLSMLFVLTKSGGITQKALSGKLFMEKSTVSRNIAGLLKKALISKAEFPIIKTTESGLELLEQVIPHWELAMQEIKTKMQTQGEQALNTLVATLTM